MTIAATVAVAPAAPIAAAPVSFPPGPLGPVTIVGDSVLAASVYPSGGHSSLSQYLADLGFGPIVARAASGLTAGFVPTGYFGMPANVTVSSWLSQWRAEGWDAAHVIGNVWAIDSGYCRTDLACARNSIQHVVEALGPGHHIWWPQITRFYTHQAEADTWNSALAEFDAARDDFTTWDWPSVLVAESFDVYDGVHLASPAEHARRSERIAQEVYRAWATAHRVGGDAALPSATSAPSRLTPVEPVRVLDTRRSQIVGAGQVVDVALTKRVPISATSVVVNVTATQATRPTRILDTRNGAGGWSPVHGADQVIDMSAAPPGAVATTGSLTAADSFSTAFETALPCGSAVPNASNVNSQPGRAAASGVTVRVDSGGRLCLWASTVTQTLFDVTGWWTSAPEEVSERWTSSERPMNLAGLPGGGRRWPFW